MTATYIREITDEMIQARIDQISYQTLSYCGRVSDPEELTERIRSMPKPTVAEVREMLQHQLCGDTARDEIDMAISIALEPDDMPENACVEVHYDE